MILSESDMFNDFQADLFLWEDGTGLFRFFEDEVDDYFYSFRDHFSCVWIFDGEEMSLASPFYPDDPAYFADFDRGSLYLHYDGYYGENVLIAMAEAEMPPTGAQWDLSMLIGTWIMTAYGDVGGIFERDEGFFPSYEEDGRYLYSDFTLYTTLLADFQIDDWEGDYEEGYELAREHYEGALWEGCGNDAWYVVFSEEDDEIDPIAVTYVDGLMLLKRGDGVEGSFPDDFVAVYEKLQIDQQFDWHEWEEWIGDYYFTEFASPNQNMEYRISITQHERYDDLTVLVEINGFQTEMMLQGWVVGNNNYVEIVFEDYVRGYRPRNAQASDLLHEGDILVTFTKWYEDITTTWGKLQPMLPENEHPGTRFEKSVG